MATAKTPKKPAKFDFQKTVTAMLMQLGAKEGGSYGLELQTVAGVLECTPYDNWLATRFLDVNAAKNLGPPGSLNPFSGKWNWHYDKASAKDVLSLFDTIARITEPSVPTQTLLDRFSLQAEGRTFRDDPHVGLTYRYKSEDGTPQEATVAFKKGSFWSSDLKVMTMAAVLKDGALHFIPGQVGLPDLQNAAGDAVWDASNDTPWHEVVKLEPLTRLQAEDLPKADVDWEDFVGRMVHVAVIAGWNEGHRPSDIDQMVERGHAGAERASVPRG
jgi:hypothetical protein